MEFHRNVTILSLKLHVFGNKIFEVLYSPDQFGYTKYHLIIYQMMLRYEK